MCGTPAPLTRRAATSHRTGRWAQWDGVGFFTVRDGRIAAGRFLADVFGLRTALGVIPEDLR